MKKEVDMEDELKNSISKRYESTSLWDILTQLGMNIKGNCKYGWY